jgi:hypothetical protein
MFVTCATGLISRPSLLPSLLSAHMTIFAACPLCERDAEVRWPVRIANRPTERNKLVVDTKTRGDGEK